MFVLHVELKVKSGAQADLEKTFGERFYPAISEQGGFLTAQLLHSTDDDSHYRLCLSFDQRDSQQKWVATDLHQQVWPLVEDLCENYVVSGYTAT
jgi:heme-degrading monooxygenase HmoA